uniref:Glycosyl transferase family 28 C-terminal domain-containing protein n=1 Tax=Chlamydomonas leiostraca TaxID=1034604 RepID=A0A7S0WPF2_9CHLO|mmetsp:Transcript_21798/g.55494  ORF Transcript_21798/g.55494 Transcript_21798/m.55494 type:complete len:191 (+) Transcript_21798:679-1251(+)
MSKRATVLVTVGSTKFDALVRAVDTEEFGKALVSKGYTHLVIQKGNGAYAPHVLVPINETLGTTKEGLHVEVFDYKPNLTDTMNEASLVISHAGSGSIFEALTAGKHLIVVPNPLLMDNHQVELGARLADMGHLVCASTEELVGAVQGFDGGKIKPYTPGAPAKVVAAMDAFLWGQQPPAAAPAAAAARS